MTCHNCKKDFPITPIEDGWVKVENYCLRNESNEIQLCLECWDSGDKEKYKQEFEKIYLHRGKSKGNMFFQHEEEYIQRIIKCEEKSCGKKFDAQTLERLRHKCEDNQKDYPDLTGLEITFAGNHGSVYRLKFEEHEELNKNSTPVKTMEDLVQQWMASQGIQKIYYDVGTFKAKGFDSKDKDDWHLMKCYAFYNKVKNWLKTQPNKEVICNSNPNNREREREREQNCQITNWDKGIRSYY